MRGPITENACWLVLLFSHVEESGHWMMSASGGRHKSYTSLQFENVCCTFRRIRDVQHCVGSICAKVIGSFFHRRDNIKAVSWSDGWFNNST